ncbi:hypothetical protein [Humitalea rosea]|nr:hypothetical protein [Humitalea rosea]
MRSGISDLAQRADAAATLRDGQQRLAPRDAVGPRLAPSRGMAWLSS